MRHALDVIAQMVDLQWDATTFPWERIEYQHTAAIRAKIAERFAPATGNKLLAALRATLRHAFQLGLMSADALAKAVSPPSIKGSRLPAGRTLAPGELRAIFSVLDPKTNAGARDAALLAVAYAAGLRRSEIVALDVDDFDAADGTLTIHGKGNRQRSGYLTNGGRAAVENWLRRRGDRSGPLFVPVNKGDVIVWRRMSDQAVLDLARRMARRAKIRTFSPHDLRRSFVTHLLDAGTDIAVVQGLAGHALVATTIRYDRRPEEARRKAVDLLHVPFVEHGGHAEPALDSSTTRARSSSR